MPSKKYPGNKPIIVPVATDQLDFFQLHRLNPSRYPYFFQSVAQLVGQPSYDILFACPQFSLELSANGRQRINADFPDTVKQHNKPIYNSSDFKKNFLKTYELLWKQEGLEREGDDTMPFSGGWFVYLGYELAKQIEPVLQAVHDENSTFPIAVATRIPAAIIKSHGDDQCFIIIEKNYQELLALIEDDIRNVKSCSEIVSNNKNRDSIIDSITEDESKDYLDNVVRIKQYIKEGDVFQVNLSRQWKATLHEGIDSDQIYTRLRDSNPAPFFALAEFGDNAIISSSPERLVKVKGRKIDTRPIAGTRPRGKTDDGDKANLDELIAHPKERAEHIMLIDLERNDLGRVCEPGSVKVNELMVLETYTHVHHIVSNVQGYLRKDVTPSDVINAVFPGGTITGCPKVRCMEIISELEKADRGPYTGSLGYVNHSGDMDFNILIRTLVKQGNKLTFRAGAGIVADSIPENELEETRAKAKGMLLAL